MADKVKARKKKKRSKVPDPTKTRAVKKKDLRGGDFRETNGFILKQWMKVKLSENPAKADKISDTLIKVASDPENIHWSKAMDILAKLTGNYDPIELHTENTVIGQVNSPLRKISDKDLEKLRKMLDE